MDNDATMATYAIGILFEAGTVWCLMTTPHRVTLGRIICGVAVVAIPIGLWLVWKG